MPEALRRRHPDTQVYRPVLQPCTAVSHCLLQQFKDKSHTIVAAVDQRFVVDGMGRGPICLCVMQLRAEGHAACGKQIQQKRVMTVVSRWMHSGGETISAATLNPKPNMLILNRIPIPQ